MSTITKVWTTEKIRNVLAALDRKTGLKGAELPIKTGNAMGRVGYFSYKPDDICFYFSLGFMNEPGRKETAAIDVIRHEYAHYYVWATGLTKWIPHQAHVWHHGEDWKYACRMVGADPIRCHDSKNFRDRDVDEAGAAALAAAEDVQEFDMVAHLKKWNVLPKPQEECDRLNRWLKEHLPAGLYFEVGDEVLQMEKGFGRVIDTYPEYNGRQMVMIRFEDGHEEVFGNRFIMKVLNGVIDATIYK
jgi:hypothetical protein